MKRGALGINWETLVYAILFMLLAAIVVIAINSIRSNLLK